MSILTRQVKDFQGNFKIYAIGFVAWLVGSFILVGITRGACGESLSAPEAVFAFCVMGMAFWTAYYAWINAYVWITRNAAGDKREMLESQADQKYRAR
jgi:uncharacterized membrane protein